MKCLNDHLILSIYIYILKLHGDGVSIKSLVSVIKADLQLNCDACIIGQILCFDEKYIGAVV